jgi:hypothetical protein
MRVEFLRRAENRDAEAETLLQKTLAAEADAPLIDQTRQALTWPELDALRRTRVHVALGRAATTWASQTRKEGGERRPLVFFTGQN